MRKKSKILLLAILLLNIVNIPNVYAETLTIETLDTGDKNKDQEKELKGEEDISISDDKATFEADGKKYINKNGQQVRYTCSYKYDSGANTVINYEVLDLNGNNILNTAKEITAGTTINLKIKEEKEIWYEVKEENIIVKKYVRTLTRTQNGSRWQKICKYKSLVDKSCQTGKKKDEAALGLNIGCPKEITGNTYYKKNLCEEASCDVPDTLADLGYMYDSSNCIEYPTYTDKWEDVLTNDTAGDSDYQKYYKDCKEMAVEAAKKAANKNLGATFNVELKNSNYTDEELKQTTASEYTTNYSTDNNKIIVSKSENEFKIDKNKEKLNDKAKSTYTYSLPKACINRKTSQVAYRTTACAEDEMEVEKVSSEFWNYFTPLSTKSNQNIEIKLSPKTKISPSGCKYVIDNNKNYTSLIIPRKENGVTKDEFSGKIGNDKDLIDKGDGCYLKISVKIPVKQKFYNEETTKEGSTVSIKFKGFNFYYRQIDYTNPFPNGLDKTSYWYDWYKSKNKNPDISKSFSTITYKTNAINTTTIREYNDTYPYTSWSNMNIDGTSKFITDDIFDTKRNITTNWYQLGCGPANAGKTGCETKWSTHLHP